MTEQPNTDFVSDRQMLIMGATQAIVIAALHPDSGAIVTDVLDLLDKVHAKVTALVDGPSVEPEIISEKVTASQVKKSITHEGLISFIDGGTYKTLRRHLTKNGETPESYRARFGLPADYPMVSAAYSAQRSELARTMGLGQQRRKAVEPVPPPVPAPKPRRAKALEAA
jgi:predicted transcriptional regulator